MAWDPLGTWPNGRKWMWLALAIWLVLLRGPRFLENIRAAPPQEIVPDFFQEYASARNWLEGLPVYADLRDTAPRYLGAPLEGRRSDVVLNAHPPTSVLLALPLSWLEFADAFLIWNIVSLAALAPSLWIVKRELSLPLAIWSLAPLIALLLLCYPLWEQCRLGQLTLVLLLLVMGGWAAERSGRPWLAGALLGAATAIKLFPGFLFIYYGLRSRWKVLAGGALMIVGLTCVTASVLGTNAYRSYLFTVLPEIQWFRVGWNNDSVWGFWSRLFDPAPERERDRSLTRPLLYSPTLATTLSIASSAMLMGLVVYAVRRSKSARVEDLTFALSIIAMLLVSPICWEHYLLLLLAPLAIVWVRLPDSDLIRTLFSVIVTALWLGHPVVWTALDLHGRTATPLHALLVLSYQFYALLAFFALVLIEMRQEVG